MLGELVVIGNALEAKELAEHAPDEEGGRFPINLLIGVAEETEYASSLRNRRRKKKSYIKLFCTAIS